MPKEGIGHYRSAHIRGHRWSVWWDGRDHITVHRDGYMFSDFTPLLNPGEQYSPVYRHAMAQEWRRIRRDARPH